MIGLWISVALSADLLDDPGYRFCHSEGWQAEDARIWCEHFAELPASRCPGWQAQCAKPATEPAAGCEQSSKPSVPQQQTPEQTSSQGCEELETPEPAMGCGAVDALARWMTAFVVVALIAGVVLFLLRYLGLRRTQTVHSPVLPKIRRQEISEDIPDLPAIDLLAEAKRAMAEQRLDEAILLARAATLRCLAERGQLELHRSSTDREYLRRVRGNEEVFSSLRILIRKVEAVRFGRIIVSLEDAKNALAAAERVIKFLLVGWFLSSSLEQADAADRLSYGDSALIELYQQAKYEVHLRQKGVVIDPSVDVLIVRAQGNPVEEEELLQIDPWIRNGGVVFWCGPTSENLNQFEDYFPETVVASPREAKPPPNFPRPLLPKRAVPLLGRSGGLPWVVDENGQSIVTMYPLDAGGLVLVDEPELCTNAALMFEQNRAFWLHSPFSGVDSYLWELEFPPTLEIRTVGSSASQTTWESLANTRLLPLMLQLLLVGLLFIWSRGVAFAPAKEESTTGRHRFTDHIEALGRQWAQVRATRRAASALAEWARQHWKPHEIREMARRRGADAATVEELLTRLEQSASDHNGPNSEMDYRLWEEWERWIRRN